ncbi:hypothetical protein HJ01_02893 [Flavobacterium frigoris PS1]|uniref:Uncharacterized protein n=1 Tax=Flavobacterium frigoris (strain PS1) TaxID=1086011 RepID=H7FUP5_FLAFP|nr:hypothetical protein HJ01_02893 [Flavobacterium frigoris PS1]
MISITEFNSYPFLSIDSIRSKYIRTNSSELYLPEDNFSLKLLIVSSFSSNTVPEFPTASVTSSFFILFGLHPEIKKVLRPADPKVAVVKKDLRFIEKNLKKIML